MSEPCDRCPAPRTCERHRSPGACERYRRLRDSAPPPPPPPRPLAETLELRELIQSCPHLEPKEPGDGCWCLGRCAAGRGDLDGGRTSYRNCESCRARELSTVDSLDKPSRDP